MEPAEYSFFFCFLVFSKLSRLATEVRCVRDVTFAQGLLSCPIVVVVLIDAVPKPGNLNNTSATTTASCRCLPFNMILMYLIQATY